MEQSFYVAGILLVVLLTAGVLEGAEMRLAEGSFVLSKGTWIAASELKAGDIVQTLDGGMIRITAVRDVNAGEPSPCYGTILNDTRLAAVAGPGVVQSTHVFDQHCNWLCRFLARLNRLVT